ncbi:MAG: hypothetical protein IKF09_00995 [Clostridiales bacterium]|nr:hypothetical protein [Clostridiales bacterium]
MKLDRAVTYFICASMVIGITGCDMFGVRKTMGAVNDALKNFNTALNDLDCDGIRSVTDWTEEDFDYDNIENLLDVNRYGDIEGKGFVSCAKYIASTINIDYDIKSLDVYSGGASIDVTYELVDWKTVYSEKHNSYDEVLKALKDSEDTLTVDSRITFENINGEWRLCQIFDLNDVLSFIYAVPDVNADAAGDGSFTDTAYFNEAGIYDFTFDLSYYNGDYVFRLIYK